MGKPIRVLHVLGTLNRGGAESRIMDIYRSIDKTVVQFDFVIHTENKCTFADEICNLGGRIFQVPRFIGRNYLKYRKSWISFLREHSDYRIIHGHMTSTAFIYLKIAKNIGVNTRIAHVRSGNKETIAKCLLSRLSHVYATNLLAVSREAAIIEFGKTKVHDGVVKIVPNAIDTKKYIFCNRTRKTIREELGLFNTIAIVHVGRFQKMKNHEFLIDLFYQIIDKGINAQLVLIGDGIERTNIEMKVQDLGLDERVQFLGVRDDVPQLLSAMDVLVFPSFYEGFPGVVLEAQASGLPCIVSDTITREVAITDLVKFLPLETGVLPWIQAITASSHITNRFDKGEEVIRSDYDINKVVEWYEQFYVMSSQSES